ncbi:MAG: serine/threonine-protein kinase, partial [Thermoanaerobaculia bacterium]
TPAYMAPEQLAGKGASVQSDLYALGLVLYELFTGHHAFQAASLAEWKHKHSEQQPTAPSTVTPGLDPAVERAILRCLEKEPGQRPRSAASVAAALPGGDPLAAAIAAGETPSPEMVAAAGEEGALSAGRAWALFGGLLAVILVILLLAPFATDLGLAPLPKSPDALEDRARELAQKLGYSERPADTASWWIRQYEYLRYRANHLPSPARVRELGSIEPHPWWFRYRQSPRAMVPTNGGALVQSLDPPFEISGMVSVTLDARGRLVQLRAVPSQIDDAKGPWPDPDWETLFREAGLDSKRFTPSSPKWLPPEAFDARAEWDGSFASHPDVPIHVTAAAYHGKPVYFAVLGPWERPTRIQEAPRTLGAVASQAALVAVILSLLLGGLILARRNLRLGRGDRRGAFRVASFVFVAWMASWILSAHHVVDLNGEFGMFIVYFGVSLFFAAFLWLTYMALEPFARRRWPDLLISWTRLLSGRFRDPLVGRDILVGILVGAVTILVSVVQNSVPAWANVSGMTPQAPDRRALGSTNFLVAVIVEGFGGVAIPTLAIMALLVLLSVLLRRRWLAIGVSTLVVTVINLTGENIAVDLPSSLLISVLMVFVAARFGILALYASLLTATLMSLCPLAPDFSHWYAGRTLFVLLSVAGLAAWGFHTALGGRPVFGSTSLEEA